MKLYCSSNSPPCSSTDSDYENANRSADVDVELMAFQSIIGDDFKGNVSMFSKETIPENISPLPFLLGGCSFSQQPVS